MPNAKISIPELPPDLVHRTGLHHVLDGVTDVGLVSAPPGYGKTLLLAEWARASTEVDTAWVRVDRDDDDPRRLWSAVLAAIAKCPTASADGLLQVGPDGTGWDMASAGQPDFLAKLIEALAVLPRPLRLVLDDLHEVTDAATLRGLQNFQRDRPRNVRLVLASRLDPPFHLHRLRLEGQLTELRIGRLRFDQVEADALLRGAGLQLTRAQVDRLYRQTDGWPAGLRLAAAAMHMTPDVDWFLTNFSGDERSVADYLVGEVFSGLPADRLQFLQATSICETLPVGLAVALSGREDAGWLLADLERRTALVRETGQDRGVYRLQPLVRSHLQADLNRQSVHRIARLHAIAAHWWTRWGRPASALEHAALADDPALLTDLVRDVAVSLLVTGEHRPLRQALAASGEEVVASDPWLTTVAALVRHEAGDAHSAEAAGRQACRTWPADPPVRLAILRAASEELGVLPRADGAARTALPDDSAVPPEPELEALLRLARCARRLHDGGDPLEVRRAIEHVRAEARDAGFEYLSLQCLGLAAAAAATGGDLRAMREIGAEAVAIGFARGWQASPLTLTGTVMLAYGKLLAAEPKEAERLAVNGLAHGGRAALRLRYMLSGIVGVARGDQGDRAGGIAAMAHARAALGDASASRFELAALAVAEFQDAIRLGRHTSARTVQRWLVERVGETADVLLMRAWSDVAAGHNQPARATLRRIIDGRPGAILPSTLVEAYLQETVLAVQAEDHFAARRTLQEAVDIAEPIDLLRPFVHAGPVVRELLAQRYGSLEAADTFGGRALAVGARGGRELEAVLSRRELAVLALLPSLRSMDEIASDLTVSINTLKSHIRSIYSKLGVSSRRCAVLAAHEHGLILSSASDYRSPQLIRHG
ncbi:MAG TPA: LuxR C-terminal-related transcriptional regulator [Pseudonocardia sp.]